MSVRSFEVSDAEALGQVFHRAIREGALTQYSDAQVAAWSPEAPNGDAWSARLSAVDTVVAVSDDALVGFMTLDDTGYLDLAFVVPEVMGKGVADMLFAVLEGRARAKRIKSLSTQASLLAEPFFARRGWKVVSKQEVEIRGVLLKNTRMEKNIFS